MSNGRIEGNRALDNNSAGIAVYEPQGRTTITGNVIGRNSGFGIELAGGVAGDRLEDNVAFGNGIGLFLFSTRNLSIRGNRSFANRGAGISLVDGASENSIEGNRVWDNGSTGIDMSEGAQTKPGGAEHHFSQCPDGLHIRSTGRAESRWGRARTTGLPETGSSRTAVSAGS